MRIKLPKFPRFPRVVIYIFIFGLLLRVIGVWFGLPLQLNIDEPTLISSVVALKQNINPGHFEWPHLYFYINLLFYFVFGAFRKIVSIISGNPWLAEDPSPYFLISRSLSAIFGSLTIFSVYLISKEIFSERVGKISALVLAVLPIAVYEAHLAKMDTANTFFTSVAVYFIWQVHKKGDLKAFIYSGIWIGLSTSIKYNGALLFLPLLVAYLLRGERFLKIFSIQTLKKFLYSGISSIIAFYVGTPFAIIDYKKFFSAERNVGAMWQFQNVGQVEWINFPTEIFNTFILMYRQQLGLSIWIIFLILIILFLFFNKRSKGYVFLMLPTIFFSLYISRFDRSPGHYFLFLIPFYVPAISGFIVEIYDFMQAKFKNMLIAKLNIYMFTGLVLFTSIYPVFKSDFLLSRKDTRNSAFEWVRSNLNQETDFLYVSGEELKSIPFQKNNTERIKKVDRSLIKNVAPFYIVIGVNGVIKEDILGGDRDPASLSGNSGPILRDATLEFYADNENRLGPPIYIFKVNSVEPETGD